MSDIEKNSTVCIEIRPQDEEPDPEHPYLQNNKGVNGTYFYYGVPWDPDFKNPIRGQANFRYGRQAYVKWDDTTVRVMD